MKKIYQLQSDTENFSYFLRTSRDNPRQSMRWLWNKPPFYHPENFMLVAGDNKKKSYKTDISTATNPFILFSENTWDSLKDILEPRGVLLDIITESKRKKFFGYYPTNAIKQGALDLDLSDYTDYPNGKVVRVATLKESKIDKDYIFTIEESKIKIFVDDKFKKRVEEAGLNGFDFSYSVQLS